MKNANHLGEHFVGTVVSTGRLSMIGDFKAGDPVAGYITEGSWSNTLDGSIQVQVRPENLWSLSASDAKDVGIPSPAGGSSCDIM
ncbi:hypothetical protein FRB95_009984 [Tulasnella sp. JGI-2019a]|nr:hypothetical protein FRB93_002893 [Tulasnella sp. JGI-2019a]KAG9025587.1 hypothetical protein FRB95_009984 [Tulasnella sp. JGI-2019a]